MSRNQATTPSAHWIRSSSLAVSMLARQVSARPTMPIHPARPATRRSCEQRSGIRPGVEVGVPQAIDERVIVGDVESIGDAPQRDEQ